MIDRFERGNRAIILHPVLPASSGPDALDEFRELAKSAGTEILHILMAPRQRPDSRYFVGSGKAAELAELVETYKADVVLVSKPLSAVQERNLETIAKCRVLDRATLILDIFAQRARTFEGKLQVETAQLRHLSTRLIRGWTHLERQKGGIGLRGPGETQLETDRRLIGLRLKQLRQKLDRVERQRNQSRRQRQRSRHPVISLVGYTNTGKSTLFNALTESEVVTRDQLFATLDPTVRRMEGVQGGPFLLVDTVGFVSDLPHELVAAFRSTLEETREADLLLHVIDGADEHHMQREQEVLEVLDKIGAAHVPVLRVINKVDLTEHTPGKLKNTQDKLTPVCISALSGVGVPDLCSELAEYFSSLRLRSWLELPVQAGKLRARLFEMGAVEEENMNEDGHWSIRVNLSDSEARQLCSMGAEESRLISSQLLADDATAA